MRIISNQPAEALQDHPVLVVEVRALDRDGDVARRQLCLVYRFDPWDDLAALFMQYQSAETRHDQARSGSRMLVKLATAAPPMLKTPASAAPGT